MTNAPQHIAGQAGHGRRPILLDWRAVARDVARPDRGQNVVYHEFAHKLDMLNGEADGSAIKVESIEMAPSGE